MTDKQPEAQRLAEQLEDTESARLHLLPYAAAELRRLHAENEDLKTLVRNSIEAIRKDEYEMAKMREVNQELLAALKLVVLTIRVGSPEYDLTDTEEIASEAIAALKERLK